LANGYVPKRSACLASHLLADTEMP